LAAGAISGGSSGNSEGSSRGTSGESSTQTRGWMNRGNPDALTDADRKLLGIPTTNGTP
jgi:hypothetical protein